MSTDLRDVLHDELGSLAVPPGDLARVRSVGTGLRRRRGLAAGVVAALVVAVLATGFARHGSTDPRGDRGVDPIGQLDFSHGLRAYAAPGGEIHLGGRAFPAQRLEYLDTDAAATAYGVVFYDDGRPMLLSESGDISALEPDAGRSGFHPTAKADSQAPLVAYGVTRGGHAEVVVRDLSTGHEVARRPVAQRTVIDGIDRGAVVLRTAAGTSVWDTGSDRLRQLAGAKTRVADVRNGVLLYTGPTPDGPAAAAYRLVPGQIDAQLTYDGGHVLYWSNRLKSTDGSAPLVLDQRADFFAVDTDGSILAARGGHGHATVYDCEVPSGHCTELGPLETTHGDPMFLGVDM